MKKIICITLLLCIALMLAACGGSRHQPLVIPEPPPAEDEYEDYDEPEVPDTEPDYQEDDTYSDTNIAQEEPEPPIPTPEPEPQEETNDLPEAEEAPTPTPERQQPPTPSDAFLFIAPADAELMGTFTHIHEFDYTAIRGASGGASFVLWTTRPLTNFAVLSFSPDFLEDYDGIVYTYLGSYGMISQLQPGEGFLIINYMGVGTLPWSGVTFVDEGGTQRYFGMQENMAYPYGDRWVIWELDSIRE